MALTSSGSRTKPTMSLAVGIAGTNQGAITHQDSGAGAAAAAYQRKSTTSDGKESTTANGVGGTMASIAANSTHGRRDAEADAQGVRVRTRGPSRGLPTTWAHPRQPRSQRDATDARRRHDRAHGATTAPGRKEYPGCRRHAAWTIDAVGTPQHNFVSALTRHRTTSPRPAGRPPFRHRVRSARAGVPAARARRSETNTRHRGETLPFSSPPMATTHTETMHDLASHDDHTTLAAEPQLELRTPPSATDILPSTTRAVSLREPSTCGTGQYNTPPLYRLLRWRALY